MKKIFLLFVLVFSFLALGQQVFAGDAILMVSPATLSKTEGASFLANVQIDPAGNSACVVKGTLTFTNLTCGSITVAEGLMPQVSPTCASPAFTIGIPKCATTLKNILTVSVKGKSAGAASLSISGPRIIGAGSDAAMILQAGNYTITAVAPAAPVQTPVQQPEQPAEQAASEQEVRQQNQAVSQNSQTEQATSQEEEIVIAQNDQDLSKETGAASLADTMGKFFKNPYVIIGAFIVLILIALLLSRKSLFKKKEGQ